MGDRADAARGARGHGGWGFEYRTNFVWAKDRAGTGYWARNKHELLLVGTRGTIPAPAPGTQWESLIEAPVGEHSAKPEAFAEMIERLYPTLPKIELFARGKAKGGTHGERKPSRRTPHD